MEIYSGSANEPTSTVVRKCLLIFEGLINGYRIEQEALILGKYTQEHSLSQSYSSSPVSNFFSKSLYILIHTP